MELMIATAGLMSMLVFSLALQHASFKKVQVTAQK